MPVHVVVESPIGDLTLVGREGALTGLYMAQHKHADADGFGAPVSPSDRGRFFGAAISQLEEYFAGGRTAFDLRLEPRGTPFQLRVWEALHSIPYGETRSYRQLAEELGDLKAIRAVAAANGRNPLSIVIPCHRVIGSDGSLVGYGGGLWRKRFLLELENPPASRPEPLF